MVHQTFIQHFNPNPIWGKHSKPEFWISIMEPYKADKVVGEEKGKKKKTGTQVEKSLNGHNFVNSWRILKILNPGESWDQGL